MSRTDDGARRAGPVVERRRPRRAGTFAGRSGACPPRRTALGALLALVLGGTTGTALANGASSADEPPLAAAEAAPASPFLAREEVRRWIAETSAERGLDRHHVAGLFARLERREDVLALIAAPAERRLEWREYRPIFLGEERVRAGRAFLERHREALARAEARFGVPPAVIGAIIGVETLYGRIVGRHRVLEALATLAFDYPPRAAFFAGELAEFLSLADEERLRAREVLGSYAGAMGLAQFIPSSYRRYAIDFDGDGRRDLFESPEDAIGSVANYLARHGWRRDEPLARRWRATPARAEAARALVRESLKPAVAFERVRALGFEDAAARESGADARPVSVMRFSGEGGEELWVGYTNFYAITRYNHSRLYALAVHQLAAALRGTP